MKGKWKETWHFSFSFFRSVTPSSQNVFFGTSTPGWGFWWKSGPCFFTKFRFGELSISQILVESRDLQSGYGFRACSFENKGKMLDFLILGVHENKQNRKQIKTVGRNRSNIGLRSSRWYQKDAEGRRGYFRKIWAWKTLEKTEKI